MVAGNAETGGVEGLSAEPCTHFLNMWPRLVKGPPHCGGVPEGEAS